MGKKELAVLGVVYMGTDCCNEVYDYCTLSRAQERIAETLVKRRLLTVRSDVVSVDGDGFIVTPEKYGNGYRLRNAGYRALTKHDPQGYPENQRRFYKLKDPQ